MSKNVMKWIPAGVLLLAVLAAAFLVDSSYFQSLVITVCAYAIFAISYDLLLGYTGIASFGHALYFGVGAYVVAYTTVRLDWPFIAGFAAMLVCCVMISFVISLITIRVKSIYFNMVTMALGQLFYVLSTKLSGITGGDDGLPGIRSIFPNKTVFYIVIVLLLVLVFLFCRRLVHSPVGRVLQAIRENETRVGLLGYDTFRYKTLIIQISGLIAGMAGALYVCFVGIAYPTLLHSTLTLQALFMVVLGGTGTLYGGIIGAVILRLADSVLSTFTSRWMLILGVVFIVMVLFFPKGVVGIVQTVAGKVRGREGEGSKK